MMQTGAERAAIAAMGRALGPEILAAVHDLYRDAQQRLAADRPVSVADAAYGDDPRQMLDLYRPEGQGGGAPVLLWVHGGGFLRGDKGGGVDPFNAHAGRWAARSGMLGAVMNYRLAPDHGWPAGAEDVGQAIDWLCANAARHGGDPRRIVAVGTSAGATHVLGHIARRPDAPGLAGAVLLSALYGVTPLSERDTLYYGTQADYAARRPFDAAVATALPLLVAGAEFDPPRFQAELAGFLGARLARHDALPRTAIVSGHNHFSLAYHLGTADTRLADEILSLVQDVTGDRP